MSDERRAQGGLLQLPEPESFLGGKVTLWSGDCLAVVPDLPENSIDSCICDPPYHLTSIVKRFGAENAAPAKRGKTGAYARASAGFMNQTWDGGDIAFRPETWAAILRALKPGAYLAAFSSTRTFGRMQVACEQAGFVTHPFIAEMFSVDTRARMFLDSLDEGQADAFLALLQSAGIGGMLGYIFGQGFPKAHRVVASGLTELDRATGGWDGWRYGTQSLKPAIEPIYLGQKPFEAGLTGTENVIKWGIGALNIDGARIQVADDDYAKNCSGDRGHADNRSRDMDFAMGCGTASKIGRWPANLILDGGDEVASLFPNTASGSGTVRQESGADKDGNRSSVYGKESRPAGTEMISYGDEGSAARFFWSSKADADDRLGSRHPTVKPVDLVQYLVRLVTPPGGLVLDPFAGTGTTGEAAWREGARAVLIERETEYQADVRRRMALALAGPDERARESVKAKMKGKPPDHGPLFENLKERRRAKPSPKVV
jgi:DNA modification methylase